MSTETGIRQVAAFHGRRQGQGLQAHEVELGDALRSHYGHHGLVELYGRFADGDGLIDALMRRTIVAAGAKRCGQGLQVGAGAVFRHIDTFEIGGDVFIGAQAILQGRHDGHCHIGRGTWIGPQAFLDARDLFIGDCVGWGPGAKVLGSEHTGIPLDVPIIETDLAIETVTIGDWADIGTNAVILPGVTVGRGAIVGAGAVVNRDVAPFSVVAGVPARFLRWRSETDNGERHA